MGLHIKHITAGKDYRNADEALRWCNLCEWVKPHEFDLVLYQAGADSHVDDPLGGIFTTAQMAQRDELVFWSAKTLGIPVAWNLAGGYQRDETGGIEPVLKLHRQTYEIARKFT